MDTPERIREMALENLDDAHAIIKSNRTSVRNARYLAGYSVELMLKSRIAQTLNIPNQFNNQYARYQEAFRIHDLYQLLFYSGLFVKLADEIENNQEGVFIKDWSRIRAWNSSWRYGIDYCTEQTAREFIKSCERVIEWIQEN